MNKEIIICECNNDEHQIIIKYDDDPNWKEVYISYHLQNLTFWNRLCYIINYLLGYKSKFGAFGELILKPDDETIDKLQRVLNKLNDVKNNSK